MFSPIWRISFQGSFHAPFLLPPFLIWGGNRRGMTAKFSSFFLVTKKKKRKLKGREGGPPVAKSIWLYWWGKDAFLLFPLFFSVSGRSPRWRRKEKKALHYFFFENQEIDWIGNAFVAGLAGNNFPFPEAAPEADGTEEKRSDTIENKLGCQFSPQKGPPAK